MKPERPNSTLDDHRLFEQQIAGQVRRVVFERDDHQCQCCGAHTQLELHHWRDFRSLGGGDTEDNLVTLCHTCHEKVHARVLDITMHFVLGRWKAYVRGEYRHRLS